MNKRLKPTKSQWHDIERIVGEDSKGALVASCTGAGKTVVGVEAMQLAHPKQLLIVGPINTKESWRRTVASQTAHTLQPIGGVTATNYEYQARMDFLNGKRGWFFCGWEFLLTLPCDEFRIDGVIFDEIHRAATRGTKTASAAYDLGRKAMIHGGVRIGLSATPFGNAPAGAWAVARALWPQDQHFRAFWSWAGRHLEETERKIERYDPRQRKKIIEIIREVGAELRPHSITRELPLYIRHEERKKCCKYHPKGIQADLPPRVTHTVAVALSDRQRRIYSDLERDMFAWIEDHDWPITTEGYPMVQSLRLHQIALAEPTTELAKRLVTDKSTGERVEEDYVKIDYPLNTKSTKLDALSDIVRDIPRKEAVLIFTHSAKIIPVLVSRLNKLKAGTAVGWWGDTSPVTRENIKKSFGQNDGVRFVVAQIASVSEGTDGLQGVCHNEIWLSFSEDNVKNLQGLGRLMRHGQKHVVNSWHIVAEDTIEVVQSARLAKNKKTMRKALKAK